MMFQENFFLIVIGILFLILLVSLIMYISNRFEWNEENKMNHRNESATELEQHITDLQITLHDLDQNILDKNDQLAQLKQQQLQPELEEALDIFDRSNIRISSDIVEDAATRHFKNVEQCVKFIENQRYVWKQENMKKLYKG